MSEAKPTQECPICGAVQPLSARTCSICGAVLSGVPSAPVLLPAERPQRRPRYDSAAGDDDLYGGELAGRIWRGVAVFAVVLALVFGIVIGGAAMRLLGGDDNNGGGGNEDVQVDLLTPGGRMTAPPTSTPRNGGEAAGPTNTPRPTMKMFTVTPAPPTPTVTPTQGPCMQTAQQGDTVYGMAIRCGHQDLSVVDLILELNDMSDPNQLQLGQTLEIPWPTATPGGEPTQPAEAPISGLADGAEAASAPATQAVNEFGTPDALALYQGIEATLRPGMAWHTVAAGETILTISYMYNTTIEVLSQINPEIPFLQCDFGSPTGGENCSVLLSQGQRVRVPVPLPTTTPTPSPVGTLTPTPTATPTFNAPYLLSPDDGAEFRSDQLVTLRWGGTGTLATNEQYLVRMVAEGSNEERTALVSEMLFILPTDWQPAAGKTLTFTWTVGIAAVDSAGNAVSVDHETDPRTFTWQGAAR